VRSAAFRQPSETLNKLVAAGVELVHVRDATLGAELDVPPPPIEPVRQPASLIATELAHDVRGLAYRGARKAYRALKRVEPLQPLLQKLRDRIRRRI
jgi:hypothetical protein